MAHAAERTLTKATQRLLLVWDNEDQTWGCQGRPEAILTHLQLIRSKHPAARHTRLLYGRQLMAAWDHDDDQAFRDLEGIQRVLERLTQGERIRVLLCGPVIKQTRPALAIQPW